MRSTEHPLAGRLAVILSCASTKFVTCVQAYLEYIQQRGFTSMFIWACPPLQVLIAAARPHPF